MVAHACNPCTLGGWATWQNPASTENTKISQTRSRLLGRLRQENRFSLGSRGYFEPRLLHCTATSVRGVKPCLKNKKKLK